MASEIVNPYQLMKNSSTVSLIQNEEDCNNVCNIFMKDPDRILGFDTEFGPKNGSNFTAATIQLSNGKFTCVIQMNKLKNIPNNLKTVLEDPTILKVGVACTYDARVISNTVDIDVKGCIELPYLASIIGNLVELKSYGLARLSNHYLQINLPKNREIRCNNWANEELSGEKIEYAASDAFHGYMIYKKIISLKSDNHNIDEIHKSIMDMKVKQKAQVHNQNVDQKQQKKKNIFCASGPHYENCVVLSTDGSVSWLTTKKRCQWYLNKNLATLILNEPFTIKLLFETKLQKNNIVDDHTKEPRKDICVSCGISTHLNRHNIVQTLQAKCKDYNIINSHDMVLICNRCTSKINSVHDHFVNKLLDDFNLVDQFQELENKNYQNKICKNLANGILINSTPASKRQEYIKKLAEIYQTSELDITSVKVNQISKLDIIINSKHHILSKYIENNFDMIDVYRKRWRQHFIDTLKPTFLPSNWSIDYKPINI